jgi:phosphinothricin acetyltransferase
VRVVLCEPRHLPDINALVNDAIARHWHFAYEPEPLAVTEAAFRAGADTHPWLIAEDADSAFLGFARAARWRERAAYAWCVETAIYLRPEARGRGVGTRLYSALFDVLAAQHFTQALAGITVPNEPSERLHRAVGMSRVALHQAVGYKHDAWHDVVFYQKPLGPDAAAPPRPLRRVAEAAPTVLARINATTGRDAR